MCIIRTSAVRWKQMQKRCLHPHTHIDRSKITHKIIEKKMETKKNKNHKMKIILVALCIVVLNSCLVLGVEVEKSFLKSQISNQKKKSLSKAFVNGQRASSEIRTGTSKEKRVFNSTL